MDEQALGRLLAEMHLEENGPPALVPDEVRQVLLAFLGLQPIADPGMARLVAVLEISYDFDQFFESQPLFDPDPGTEDECAASSVETMMSYLQVTSRAFASDQPGGREPRHRAASGVSSRGPGGRKVCLQSGGHARPARVSHFQGSGLAGRIIQTANSAVYGPRQPIGSIPRAIAYIGCDTT